MRIEERILLEAFRAVVANLGDSGGQFQHGQQLPNAGINIHVPTGRVTQQINPEARARLEQADMRKKGIPAGRRGAVEIIA